MPLFVAGLSHKNAPIELRERLAVEEDKLRELLRDIAATGAVDEALVLSTCNRVEVYGVAAVPGEARAVAFRHLCAHRGVGLTAIEPLLYTHLEAEAVRHAFRVASSL
ncbi:MAG TPA: glutamyl-tRNA reductase, partial [Methylomirabilota bacterium]|nr:glutamyl-tRNA reductase [Methylomirabilota bacterium]